MENFLKMMLDESSGEDYCEAVTNSNPILSKLNDFRKNDLFCDVTIIVGSTSFRAHRLVLSALSPFFEVLLNKHFAESKQETISINSVDPDIMDIFFDFAYTNRFKFSKFNALDLLLAADLFQVLEVKEKVCAYLLGHIDNSNCFEILNVATMLQCTNLKERSKFYILRNFSELYKDPRFLELNHEIMIDIVADDNLIVKEEETVFKAVFKWISRNPGERKENCISAIKALRFANVRPGYLLDVVDFHPLIIKCQELQQLIKKALAFRLDHKLKSPFDPIQYKHRKIIFEYHGMAVSEKQNSFLADKNDNVMIWCYNPILQKKEYQLPSVFQIKRLPGMTVHGGYLYVAGSKGQPVGYFFGDISDGYIVEKFDLSYKQWKLVANVPRLISGQYDAEGTPVIVAFNEKLYIRVTTRPFFDVYSIETKTLSQSSWMKKTRSEAAGVCIWDNYIYIIGGGILDVERYNMLTDTWEIIAPIPVSVSFPGIAVKDGRIFVKLSENDEKALVYDPFKNLWSSYTL